MRWWLFSFVARGRRGAGSARRGERDRRAPALLRRDDHPRVRAARPGHAARSRPLAALPGAERADCAGVRAVDGCCRLPVPEYAGRRRSADHPGDALQPRDARIPRQRVARQPHRALRPADAGGLARPPAPHARTDGLPAAREAALAHAAGRAVVRHADRVHRRAAPALSAADRPQPVGHPARDRVAGRLWADGVRAFRARLPGDADHGERSARHQLVLRQAALAPDGGRHRAPASGGRAVTGRRRRARRAVVSPAAGAAGRRSSRRRAVPGEPTSSRRSRCSTIATATIRSFCRT